MLRLAKTGIVGLLLLMGLSLFLPVVAREGDDRVGLKAPLFGLERWINSAPLEISDLAGRVVLVRWWTDSCPFCLTSAPALNELQSRYGDQGLQVLGIFHPKPPGDLHTDVVRLAADRLAFRFPVAVDADWKALDRWWLSHQRRDWTSVSFLIDKEGIIRYVHAGGEYHQGSGGRHWPDHTICQRDYRELESRIEQLLAE